MASRQGEGIVGRHRLCAVGREHSELPATVVELQQSAFIEGAERHRREGAMSEAYTVEVADETVGIIVRQEGERGYRFHSAKREFDALDGLVFVKPAAAEQAAVEFVRLRGRARAQNAADGRGAPRDRARIRRRA
jgi:hypothetical protein